MPDNDTPTDDDGAVASRRRRLLNWLAGLGVASFAVGLVAPLKDLAVVAEAVGEGGDRASNLPGQRLVYAHAHESDPEHVHEAGAYVLAEHLEAPTGLLVYPEDLTQDDTFLINLHRLETDAIEEPTDLDLTDDGFVAYSALCTHLGCTASWTEEAHEVGTAHDHCPCHVGEFDPYRGAAVVGGPPPRPLPQIGVTVNDAGEVELTSEFTGTVGIE